MAWDLATDWIGTKWNNRNINGYYIDPQNGNDLNDGHPKRPLKTTDRARVLYGTSKRLYVSPGLLKLTLSQENYIISDTKHGLIIDGFLLGGIGAFRNGCQLVDGAIIQNIVLLSNASNSQFVNLYNCIVKNVTNATTGSGNASSILATYSNTSFNNCKNIQCRNFLNCDFINGSEVFGGGFLGFVASIVNCDFDNTSYISTDVFLGNTIFDFCNVRGAIGSFTASAYKLANPNQLQNSLTSPDDNATNDPQRLNEASGDNSLSLTSPNRNSASNGLHIGSVGVGVGAFGLADYTNVVNAVWDVPLLAWVQIDQLLKATIESIVKDLGETFSVNLIDVFGFNDNITNNHIDETLPFVLANDVPSGSILTGKVYIVKGYSNVQYNNRNYGENSTFIGVAGVLIYATTGTGTVNEVIEIPDQRVLEVRYSSISAADVLTQTYKRFIIGIGLIEDTLGVGVGESTHDYGNQTSVICQFFQIKISMLQK